MSLAGPKVTLLACFHFAIRFIRASYFSFFIFSLVLYIEESSMQAKQFMVEQPTTEPRAKIWP